MADNFEIMMPSFLKTSENISNYFDDDKEIRGELLDKLELAARNNCFHSLKAKRLTDVVKQVTNSITPETKTKDIMDLFSAKKEELLENEPDVSEDPSFKMYSSEVQKLIDHADGVKRSTNLEDDDIEMTQDDINVIDPFTKKRMTDPVRNKICNHVYERESVTQILKMNDKTRCPVVGCSNKNAIEMKNMIADMVTRKYLHDNPAK